MSKSRIFVAPELMTRPTKIGLIGMAATLVIALILYFAASVSLKVIVPFFMPWSVLLLIGLTHRRY